MFSWSKDIRRMTGCNGSPLRLMRSLKSAVLCAVPLPSVATLGTIGSFFKCYRSPIGSSEGHTAVLWASASGPVVVVAVQGLRW